MKLYLHQPLYFGYLGFFENISKSDVFVAYDNTLFSDDNFQHYNYIDGNKIGLKVCKGSTHSNICDVKIQDRREALNIDRITKAYISCDSFNRYICVIRDMICADSDKLGDYNIGNIRTVNKLLGIDKEIVRASDLGIPKVSKVIDIINIAKCTGCDTIIAGSDLEYLCDEDRRLLRDSGISIEVRKYDNKLSVIDYLMRR